jgi:hypothetical protein
MTNHQIDNMSIQQLVNKIKKLSISIDNNIGEMRNGPDEIINYCNEMDTYVSNLKARIEEYAQDE